MRRVPSLEIKRLDRLCGRARSILAELFVSNAIQPIEGEPFIAWGQYLDLRSRGLSKQYGIYGTSAGIQVLAMHDARIHEELVNAATYVLPLGDEGPQPTASALHGYFADKGDLNVTYKVAALVDAVRPDLDSVQGTHPAVERLLAMRHPGGGWPDFRSPTLDEFHGPKVHASASALLALSRFPDIKYSPACREATEWLSKRIDPEASSIATLSICYLALSEAVLAGIATQEVHETWVRCRLRISQWASVCTPEDVRRALEATEYLLPKRNASLPLINAAQDFRFLLYSPHCLAAIALMRSHSGPPGPHSRRYVMSLVSVVARQICQAGSFVAAGRTGVSSVEHLWMYRLLRDFQRWHPYVGRHQVLRDWLWRLVAPRRWVTVGMCVAAAWAILGQASSALSGILLTSVLTVSLTVISTMVYDDVFGR